MLPLSAGWLAGRRVTAGADRGDVRPDRPRLGVHPGHRLRLRRPRQRGHAGQRRRAPRWRCRRRAARPAAPAAYGAGRGRPVEVRGAGPATRQVNNFGVPGVWDHAEKLICCELITPAGNWSSYPPHKHDATEPCPVVNEEIYYYRIAGPDQVTPSRAASATTAPTPARSTRPPGWRALDETRRGPRPRRRPGAARLPRAVRRGAGLPDVLPQRDGRPGRRPGAGVLRRPGPRLGPRHLGRHADRPALPDDLGRRVDNAVRYEPDEEQT